MLIEKQLHLMLSTAYRFVVEVDFHPVGAFTQCTPPTIEWEVETVKEGGLNTYVHQLPGPRKQANVSLHHGVCFMDEMMLWYIRAMDEDFSRKRVTIALLSSMFVPVMVWHIKDAFPVRWSMPQLQTDSNTAAIQTLELACGEITIG